MSSVNPDCENPAPRQKTAKRNMELMNMVFLPNRSATLPKNKSSEPDVRLTFSQFLYSTRTRGTHDVAAFIHVISALLILNSLPAKLLITVIAPVKKLVIATAIVTDITNRHSCSVEVKQSGRVFGSLTLIGGARAVPSSASFSAMSHVCNNGMMSFWDGDQRLRMCEVCIVRSEDGM
jgi:hypothetical protein